jgi:hypothetical protein
MFFQGRGMDMEKGIAERAKVIADELRKELTFDTAINNLALSMAALEELYRLFKERGEIANQIEEATLELRQNHIDENKNNQIAIKNDGVEIEKFHALVQKISLQKEKAASARHKENRDLKDDAFQWLDANFTTCKSMDAAGEALIKGVIPVSFRTARSYVTDWKKLRSTSTP